MSYSEKHPARRTSRSRSSGFGCLWNFLAALILLLTIAAAIYMGLIFINPDSPLNILPPRGAAPTVTLIPTLDIGGPTPTIRNQLPPTWTPTPSPNPSQAPVDQNTPTPTRTPLTGPSATPEPTVTATVPTDTPTPGKYPYVIQNGNPVYTFNLFHPELGCAWMGVGGQALDRRGSPVIGLVVQVGGTLNGQSFDTQLSLTGVAKEYGTGGYEIQIFSAPIETTNELYIQLFDPGTNEPVSEKTYFNTRNSCTENLILITFQQK
jgi:hypothetical protein